MLLKGVHFQPFPNAQNGGETKGEVESEGLECPFSHMEGDLDLQEIPKPVPISKKKNTKEKDNYIER
jgi:hypothetical protein